MPPRKQRAPRVLTPIALALLLAACATPPKPPPRPVVIQPPAIPPLPSAARQPPAPDWCLPTCSAGLTTRRANWQQRLTPPAPQASPASAPMTH